MLPSFKHHSHFCKVVENGKKSIEPDCYYKNSQPVVTPEASHAIDYSRILFPNFGRLRQLLRCKEISVTHV